MSITNKQNASAFAHCIKALGFDVYVAEAGTYGFITDGVRVLSFEFSDGAKLSGNYGPASATSGTGWRLEQAPQDLKTANDVRKALYELAPRWCGEGFSYYSSPAQHLAMYGASSRYEKI